MTGVDEARAAVYLRMMYPGDFTYIDELIQAVRDEEWDRHCAGEKCSDGYAVECYGCLAAETRHCP